MNENFLRGRKLEGKKKSTLLIGKHKVNIRPRIVIVRET